MSDPSFNRFGEYVPNAQGEMKCDTSVVTHIHALGSLSSLGEDPVISYVTANHRADFIVDQVERHIHTSEIFFPRSGSAVMIFMTAGPDGGPDPNTVQAYRIEPGCPFICNRGVWHWVPFPIGDRWETFILMEDDLVENDLEIVNLEQPIQLIP